MKKVLITAVLILVLPVALALGLRWALTRQTLSSRADYQERMNRAYERFSRPEWGPLTPDQEKELLEAHRPLLIVSRGSAGPIDIDTGYLASRHPVDCGTGRSLAPDARRELLAPLAGNREVCLADGPARSVFPPAGPLCGSEGVCARVFTGVQYGNVRLEDSETAPPKPWIFLRYQFVYGTHGLPEGLIDQQRIVNRIGTADAWRPLDFHVTAWTVLDENQLPVAAILSQHDGHRTYVFGANMPWPKAGRPQIVSASRSNALYPDLPLDYRRRVRATPFPFRREYLASGAGRNWLDADDIVCGRDCGGARWDYRMERVRPLDPLWNFAGYLGPRELTFGIETGRSGPMGGKFFTQPELVRPEDLLFFSYFEDGSAEDAAAGRAHLGGLNGRLTDTAVQALVRHGRQRLRAALEKARQNPPGPEQADETEPAAAEAPELPLPKPLIAPDFSQPPVIGYRAHRGIPAQGVPGETSGGGDIHASPEPADSAVPPAE